MVLPSAGRLAGIAPRRPRAVDDLLDQHTSVLSSLGEQVVQTTVADAVGEWWIHPLASYQDRPYPRTVFGAIASDGKVLACEFNHGTGKTKRHVVGSAVVDDHNVPALWVLDGHRSLLSWTNHNADNILRLKVGARNGDLASFENAPELEIDIGNWASYTQIHRIESLSSETQDMFWVFMRRATVTWGIMRISVDQRTGAVTPGPWQPIMSSSSNLGGSDQQCYMSTADAHDPDTQRIRIAFGYNPAATLHAICALEIDCETGDITNPVDPSLSANINGTNLPLADVAVTPMVPEPEAGHSRRLFYVRPGPDPFGALYADWAINDEDNATYKVIEQRPNGVLVPGTGTATAAYDDEMDLTEGFIYTAIVETPSSEPGDDMEVGGRYHDIAADGWRFRVRTTKGVAVNLWTSDGLRTHLTTGTIPFEWGDTIGVRLQVDATSENRIRYYYSLNPLDAAPAWVQMGTLGVTYTGTIIATDAPLVVPAKTESMQHAVGVFFAELRSITARVVAQADFLNDWPVGSSSFTDGQGISWSLTGNAVVEEHPDIDPYDTTELGTSGTRVGYNQSANYIAGMAFENPSRDGVILRARTDGTTEHVERLHPDGQGDYLVESLLTQPTSQGRLARPYPPINGGPFAALITNITKYDHFTDYEGDVRGLS